MRVFYGIVLDAQVKNKLYEIEQQVCKRSTKGRFVAKDNFHITLKFLGEIGLGKVEYYSRLLENSVSRRHAFTLIADHIGSFKRGNKIIPWIGLKENKDLMTMNRKIQEILFNCDGTAIEKYTPHITLGREVILTDDLNNLIINAFEIVVNKIALFESKRVDNQLVYQEKSVITLN